jgi:hypothetical protein
MAISDCMVIIDESSLSAAYRFILSLSAEDAPDQESDFTTAMRQAAGASDEDHNFATA